MNSKLFETLLAKHMAEVANSPIARTTFWSEGKIRERAYELATFELVKILSEKVDKLESQVADLEEENKGLREQVTQLGGSPADNGY